jgi:hypothetical protein
MRSDTAYSQKTNITTLAATAGVLAFVVWVASFATPRDSIYAQVRYAPPSTSADLSPSHDGADVHRFADRGPTRGRG